MGNVCLEGDDGFKYGTLDAPLALTSSTIDIYHFSLPLSDVKMIYVLSKSPFGVSFVSIFVDSDLNFRGLIAFMGLTGDQEG